MKHPSSKKAVSWPRTLNSFAALIGSDRNLTQGPGGNISLKEDGRIWIKASGTHLKDALLKPIFVGLDLVEARQNISDGDEIFINRFGLNENSLRASIETAMHVQIQAPYVAHVHSVGSVSMSVLLDQEVAIKTAQSFCEVVYVPYVKPGIKLARELERALTPNSKAALLGNHGLTVWGDSSEECMEIIQNLEQIWNEALQKSALPQQDQIEQIEGWKEVLSRGVLVPDEIVFLGDSAFCFNDSAIDAFSLLSIENQKEVNGSDWLRDFVNILEVAARYVRNPDRLRYLTASEIAELISWDAEKYRQDLK